MTVSRPNAIFSDTFDSGAADAVVGAGPVRVVRSTTAAGIPAGGANRGLEVTLPGGSRQPRELRHGQHTDRRDDATTRSSAFNRNTLTSGTVAATALTLFEGRTAANGQVFAVQFHRLGTAASARSGPCMSRYGSDGARPGRG